MDRDPQFVAIERLFPLAFILVLVIYAVGVIAKNWPSLAWIATLMIGIGLSAYGAFQLLQSLAARKWTAVPAIVLKSSVGEVYVLGRPGHHEYFPIVRFSYSTAAGARESSRFSLAAQDYRELDESAILEVLAAYQPGAQVTAYVPPDDPASGVLQRAVSSERQSHHLALLIGGLLVVAVSLVVPLVLQP